MLVFTEHGTRRMHPGGVTAHPAGERAVQQARNLAMTLGERSGDFRFVIRDRGSNFTASLDAAFEAAGATIVRTAVQAPRMNATCERLAGTLRRELLDRVLIHGAAHLRAVLAEDQEHYNTARTRESPRASLTDPKGPRQTLTTGDPPKTCPERPDQRVPASRQRSKKKQLKAQNPNFERHKNRKSGASC